MKKIALTLILSISLLSFALGNDIRITNLALTDQNGIEEYYMVQFDLEWDNSWRSFITGQFFDVPTWDAAWIFVKYRIGNGEWMHAKLNDTGHLTGIGTPQTIDIGLPDEFQPFDVVSNPGVGAFIYRSTTGQGTFSAQEIKLRWNYGVDGVPGNATIDVKAYAIEMVMVPEGMFWAGSGGTESLSFKAGGIAGNEPFRVTEDWDNKIGDNLNELWVNSTNVQPGQLHANFPTGYKGFYSMKYPITQQQYVYFFNSLTIQQQEYLSIQNGIFAPPGNSFAWGVPMNHPWLNRNGTSVVTSAISGVSPAILETSLPNVPMNFIRFRDIWSYAHWAGLRMMSDLEYEKAARGMDFPVPNGYPWGTDQVHSGDYTYGNLGMIDEQVTIGYNTTSVEGNANYNSTNSILVGMARVGVYATTSSDMVQSGGSFWGIMDLAGNIAEYYMIVTYSLFHDYDGRHGDGNLQQNGLSNILIGYNSVGDPVYPAGDAPGVRGGSFSSPEDELQISDRSKTQSSANWNWNYGGRLGRSLPSN